MITKIKQFKESFNFNIERPKPENWNQLLELIITYIKMYGNECDLNFIDTSLITNMSYLFFQLDTRNFNGDISKWNVSNVTNINSMFEYSNFNGDISEWNVSNVTNMNWLFKDSKFEGNIDDWNINPNCVMSAVFYNTELERQNKLPIWYKE